ncbi:hypothetical protein BU26DRAFT_285562 [Trematosphaeria pertusa]|uniref:Secreted protein n=1 Tax=Trematosphaeria pertusa TaxID=390896 RepID=A0A6A6IM49_9PLEO|nr:uncharacterized protein BU26DRAFT_285562 [Trematosphaeria pertusa]KAF2251521.1 hypothetical protein BU26DRAFT_285562 [Trematosphaeria pertusa]
MFCFLMKTAWWLGSLVIRVQLRRSRVAVQQQAACAALSVAELVLAEFWCWLEEMEHILNRREAEDRQMGRIHSTPVEYAHSSIVRDR